jgi:hypothetical protein
MAFSKAAVVTISPIGAGAFTRISLEGSEQVRASETRFA